MAERFDGGRADFVAAADRKCQAVTFEPCIGLENDIRRRVIGIGVNGVSPLLLRRRKSENRKQKDR